MTIPKSDIMANIHKLKALCDRPHVRLPEEYVRAESLFGKLTHFLWALSGAEQVRHALVPFGGSRDRLAVHLRMTTRSVNRWLAGEFTKVPEDLEDRIDIAVGCHMVLRAIIQALDTPERTPGSTTRRGPREKLGVSSDDVQEFRAATVRALGQPDTWTRKQALFFCRAAVELSVDEDLGLWTPRAEGVHW